MKEVREYVWLVPLCMGLFEIHTDHVFACHMCVAVHIHVNVRSCVEVCIFIRDVHFCIWCMHVWYVCMYECAHAGLRDQSLTPKSVLSCPEPLFINAVYFHLK